MTEGVITTGDTSGRVLRRLFTFDAAHLVASAIASEGIDSSITCDIAAAARGDRPYIVRIPQEHAEMLESRELAAA